MRKPVDPRGTLTTTIYKNHRGVWVRETRNDRNQVVSYTTSKVKATLLKYK